MKKKCVVCRKEMQTKKDLIKCRQCIHNDKAGNKVSPGPVLVIYDKV